MLYLGTPYVPTSGNGLTVLQSILPIAGPLCGPNSDHYGRCANQRGPQLPSWYQRVPLRKYTPLTFAPVWGPEPIALGFIGAPLATAISFNLISISSIVYGIFFVPNTAWHPITRRTFTNLGVLVRLGLGGVGLSYQSVISLLLTTYVHVQGKLHLSGGVGNSSAVSLFLLAVGMAALMRRYLVAASL